MKNEKDCLIVPETKVAHLLDEYPELEEVLIAMAPPFAKLRNPVLRKTVARVTTLQQAARVGGISVGRMINQLRSAAGIDESYSAVEEPEEDSAAESRPAWCDPGRVAKRIDIRPVLERGEKPIEMVLRNLGDLDQGQVLELTAPFLPAPLIDVAKAKGLETWWFKEAPELVRVYFKKSELISLG